MKKSHLPLSLAILIPVIFVFKAFFLPGPLAWNDAPYFVSEYVKTFIGVPYIWTLWGEDIGRVSNVLWIHPLMLLWGILAGLGLGSGAIVRILFYFPGVVLSLISSALFVKYLGFGRTVQFFTSLLYTLNTYFILLVDGGQIGVVLAYGLFPVSLLALCKLFDKPKISSFYQALVFFTLLSTADMRIAVICLLTALLRFVVEVLIGDTKFSKNHFFVLLLFGFSILGLNMYWFLPTSALLPSGGQGSAGELHIDSLLNSLFLYQPHWYLNEFGKASAVPFYFVGIPLLIFGSLWTNKKTFVYTLCFLLFAFLSKGTTPPLGFLYQYATDHIPLGVAFRDSTKFFIPLVLFAGILVGTTTEWLMELLGRWNKKVMWAVAGVIYVYLLALITPALFGKMHGVLAGRRINTDIQKVNYLIINDPGFFRVAWFPEHSPFSLHTTEKPILDAKILTNKRPFATLNTGTMDRFNFLHDPAFLDWFDLFDIRYLVFSGDPRKLSLNQEEQYDWDNLLNLVQTNDRLQKIPLSTNFPVYRTPQTKPHVFGAEKLFVVVGGDDIYQKIKDNNPNFSPSNQPFIFAQDGKWDPAKLEQASSESAALVFNDTTEKDLAFSFLQEYFSTPSKKSEWALRGSGDYLKYKYELLVNNINFNEFDYGRGIAFSTKKGEKLVFNLSVPVSGSYVVARRELNVVGKFEWIVNDLQEFKKGTQTIAIENPGGTQVVNVAAIIPKEKLEAANKLADEIVSKFQVVDVKKDGWSVFAKNLSLWVPVDYKFINPTKYSVKVPEGVHWIVFTDSFSSMWEAVEANQHGESYPFYSAVNGFYVNPGDTQLLFKGQEVVRRGLWVSGATLTALMLCFLVLNFKKK